MKTPWRFQKGFSLLEVVLSVGIFAFVGVGLISLFSLGLDANRDSSEKLLSANFGAALIDARRAKPTGAIPSFPLPPLNLDANNTTTPVLLDDECNVTTDPGKAVLSLVYHIQGPNAAQGRNGISQVHLKFSWPPQNPDASGSLEIATTIALK